MHGPCPPRRVRGDGLSAVALLAALPTLAGCNESLGSSGPGLFATVALLVAGGSGYAIGHLSARRRGDAALRSAHRDSHSLAGLIDAWSWQTDAGHRLQRLQPPAGAAALEWSRSPVNGGLLWERFECESAADGPGLRGRLESQMPFGDLRVRQLGGAPKDAAGWLLRAEPRFDDLGRFAGYTGTARPTAEADGQRADQAALLALLATLDTPALLALDAGTPAGWQLHHANPAAQRLLDAELPPWAEMLAKLPAALREALVSGPADAAELDGWRLRRWSIDGRPALLLLKAERREADADDAGEGASFSFTLSHDLRAPIRVVEGFTRIVKEDYGRQLDRVGNDHLDRVLGAAARMNHMIDALLTLAKLSQQPLARQPVNLSQLAVYVIDDLRRAAPERLADVEIEPGLLVHGDPTLLRLVLENLLGNAWKYTARCKKANIAFGSTIHQGRLTFVVRDNGAGFDMRSADRLFGLFQRLHSANDFPGTGVGLASVKRIVRRHGGEVWADAEVGRGAAFHFTLRD